jgi:flagellar biosynthesis/type III secretory pathway protein FliH
MLTPLPTAKAPKQKVAKSKLPYPALTEKTPRKKPVLRQAWGSGDNTASPEEKRLKELEKMLGEAQSRAAIVEQEAYDKAYAAGEQAGLTLGEKRAEQIVDTMVKVAAAAEKELGHLQHQSIEVITTLTEHMVKKIVGSDENNFQQIIEQAIHVSLSQLEMTGQQSVVLAVHPHDLEMFKRMDSLTQRLSIKANENIQQGSCKLLTPHHDALIDPQLMIKKASKHIHRQFIRLYEAQHD